MKITVWYEHQCPDGVMIDGKFLARCPHNEKSYPFEIDARYTTGYVIPEFRCYYTDRILFCYGKTMPENAVTMVRTLSKEL